VFNYNYERQTLYSPKDYVIVVGDIMVYFTNIKPTKHYKEEHKSEVPLDKVVAIIYGTKNPRKNGETFEIENEGYYIVFKIENNILWIINAKNQKR